VVSQWFGHGVTCIFIVIGLAQSKGCNPANAGRGLAPDDGGSVSLLPLIHCNRELAPPTFDLHCP
uniref:hypothetical protein n=1 Tax=Pseudomonas viridiflava TaxID=33069 RepID=UPI00197EA117